jgi:outer membrane lipoprotein carrier protein
MAMGFSSLFGCLMTFFQTPLLTDSHKAVSQRMLIRWNIVLRLFCLLPLCFMDCTAHADSIDVLASFLKTTQSAQSRFVQTVITPARPGRAERQKKSSGQFSFIRPERFRFEYEKPYSQTLVCDGHTLWVYDKDIAQVSSKPISQGLLNTPAAIIAWAQDLKTLEKSFTLESQPPEAGIQWVKLTPVQPDGALLFLRLGLQANEAGVALARLEMVDAFNQRSVLMFEDFVLNPKSLGGENFVFKPPPGVEVIKGE